MGYRTFNDQQGGRWEVRERTKSEWDLLPVGGTPGKPKSVQAPGYETDPFELSEEELQKLLGEADGETRKKPPKSPFLD